MNLSSTLWLGSGESLKDYSKLVQLYAGKEPGTALEVSASSSLKAEAFNTEKERIGLMLLDRQGTTGVINIHGSLVNAHDWWHSYAIGKVTSYAAIRDALNILENDKTIVDVTLSVESTGGAVSGIDVLSDSIRKLRRKKRVVAHSEVAAMSAGYWIASSADVFTASRMAEVGSIGVIAIYTDFSKAAEEHGFQYHVFSAGKEKAYGFGGTEFTEEEKEVIQSRIDKVYNFFLSHVARNRKLKVRDKEQWADAKIFFSGEARSVGLVDAISTIEDAIGGKTASKHKGKGNAMTIDQEKLARISAGESPETVLSAEELDLFLSVEEEEVEAEAEEPEVKAEAEETEEVQFETLQATDASEMIQMARDLGKAEASLAAAEAQVELLAGKLATAESQISDLKVVAQAAVTNLQVALGKPKEQKDAPADIVQQHKDLRAQLEGRFPTSRQSSPDKTVESATTVRVPHPLRPQ